MTNQCRHAGRDGRVAIHQNAHVIVATAVPLPAPDAAIPSGHIGVADHSPFAIRQIRLLRIVEGRKSVPIDVGQMSTIGSSS